MPKTCSEMGWRLVEDHIVAACLGIYCVIAAT